MLHQRVHELEAGVDDDVPAYLLLQLRDLVRHVAVQDRRVVPIEIFEGRGHDVLGQAVQPVRPLATPGRPPRGEELVAAPAQQQGLGAQRLVELDLGPRFAVLVPNLARYEQAESVSLAFVTALQVLPPRQLAVLVLRDVLGFHASEVAGMLDSTVESVSSALKRARASLQRRRPTAAGDGPPPAPGSPSEDAIVAKFVRAWESADLDARPYPHRRPDLRHDPLREQRAPILRATAIAAKPMTSFGTVDVRGSETPLEVLVQLPPAHQDASRSDSPRMISTGQGA